MNGRPSYSSCDRISAVKGHEAAPYNSRTGTSLIRRVQSRAGLSRDWVGNLLRCLEAHSQLRRLCRPVAMSLRGSRFGIRGTEFFHDRRMGHES